MGSNTSTDEDDDEFDEVLRAVAHAPPREPPREAAAGSRWSSRYTIDRKLGSGGMGTVYLATDSLLGRQVALKVLHPSEHREADAQRERLLREARLAAVVEHERVARVYDVGEHEDRLFVAMEYVRGINLRAWMETPRTPAEIFAVIVQIAEGLEVLHGASIVHRDLKPENVMLPDAGGVKLLDFGLANQVAEPVPDAGVATGSGSVSAFQGTVGYIAPEGHTDARADIFALGVVVFELVTGERPFPPVHGAPLVDLLRAKPARCDGELWKRFPKGLGAIVARMLDVDRDARFGDGKAVRLALPSLAAPSTRGGARPLWLGLGVAALAIGADIAQPKKHERPAGPPPAGMALIDEGEIVVGQTAEAIEAQCKEIGPKCTDNPTEPEALQDKQGLLRVLGYQAPRVTVYVAPFYLDIHEVTNRDMVDLLNQLNGSLSVEEDDKTHVPRYVRFQQGAGTTDFLVDLHATRSGIEIGPNRTFRVREGRGQWPVAQVTWFGADAYCRAQGKRLPTENEWEAAARGHDDRLFPWGAQLPRCGDINLSNDAFMSLPGCPAEPASVDVMSSPQDVTPQGVHDLGGSVSEWVSTAFSEAGRNREGKSEKDSPRIVRGGSWAFSFSVHTSVRNKRPPNAGSRNQGFRCALDI